MILKLIVVPSLFVIAGLVLLGIAMLAPARVEARAESRQPAKFSSASQTSERIRAIERLAREPNGIGKLHDALDDPDPQVSAVAAVLLRDYKT